MKNLKSLSLSLKGTLLMFSLLILTTFISPLVSHASDVVYFPNTIDTLQERINVQVVLNRVMDPSPAITVDGVFGTKTIEAIKTFQISQGLAGDGKIGPLTRYALEQEQISQSGIDATSTNPYSSTASSAYSTPTTSTTATTQPGCFPGAVYSTTTGQLCNSSDIYPLGCSSTTKYSYITGLLCGTATIPTTTTTTTTTTTPPITTPNTSSELMTNGGFELGNLTGWTTSGSYWNVGSEVPYGSAGTQGGNYIAYTNAGNSNGYIYQDVDVSSYTTSIDAGTATVTASGWGVSSEYPRQDKSQIKIMFLDSAKTLISTAVDSGVIDAESWWQKGITDYSIPKNTRFIRMWGNTFEPTYYGGSIDSFSVKVGYTGTPVASIVCTNGGTNYPTCTPPVTTCSNGGTNYPTCTPPVTICSNGATNYPTCTLTPTTETANYYVSPNGNDSNKGTSISSPFKTIKHAYDMASAGDLVYFLAGTYPISSEMVLSGKNGTSNTNRIRFFAYPGEKVVFDTSSISDTGNTLHCIQFQGDYWQWKGIEIVGCPQYPGRNMSVAFWAGGNNNIFEQMSFHDNYANGFVLRGKTFSETNNNLILNSDAYNNRDLVLSDGNANGFMSVTATGTTNTFRGDRAWWNSDDGFDNFNGDGAIVFENSWAFWNGYNPGTFTHVDGEDGMGFKMGESQTHQGIITRTAKNSLAFENYGWGFDQNDLDDSIEIDNSVAYKNQVGIRLGHKSQIHIVKNSISFDNSLYDAGLNTGSTNSNNAWNSGIWTGGGSMSAAYKVSDSDFLSLDSSGANGPRQADGSLPNLQFLHLKSTSNLLSKGLGAYGVSSSTTTTTPVVNTCSNGGTNYPTCTLPTTNTCPSSTKPSTSCTVTNGTGTQSVSCSGTTWVTGSCAVSSCNSGYSISGNSCTVVNGNSLTINGQTFTSGKSISVTTPTSLYFTNNLITGKDSGYHFVVTAPGEGASSYNNYLDGAIITGNKTVDSSGSNEDEFYNVGFNINDIIKYNYGDAGSATGVYGIGFKSGNPNMTYTSGGYAYNILKNTYIAVRIKGANGTKVYNNTFYDNMHSSSPALIFISANTDISNPTASTGTKIKNNIFYTKYNIYNISIPDSATLSGFESDYNVFYSESGNPMFNYLGSAKTFAQWQALGYDTHSVVVNPNFIDTVNFVPSARLNYGTNLGTTWQAGLATNATWVTGTSPSTTNQDSTWQVGARVYSSSSTTTTTTTTTDTTKPTITSFSVPSTLSSLTVPVTSFSATDNVAVTKYLLSESISIPSLTDSGWTSSPSSSYTFASQGSKILYAWVRDSAGNISSPSYGSVTITIPTTTTSTSTAVNVNTSGSTSSSNVTTFDWGNVGTFPSNMSWHVGGSCDYDTPSIPNTLGTPSLASKISGFYGWNFATGYNNNTTTVDKNVTLNGKPSIHFQLYPFSPTLPGCTDSGTSGGSGIGAANYRDEIYMTSSSFGYAFALGSEVWQSWGYYFPDENYMFDKYGDGEGAIHQIYAGAPGVSPPIELWQHGSWGNKLIVSVNGKATNTQYPLTAKHWLYFTEHIIWSNGSDGVYELWVKDLTTGVETKVMSYTGGTTPTNTGGTDKFGFYHYSWHTKTTDSANGSIATGTSKMEAYLSPIKIEYNLSGHYNSSGKSDVQP